MAQKTRGDKIGMVLKPLNDVRRKFSADHYATSPILPPEWLYQGVAA